MYLFCWGVVTHRTHCPVGLQCYYNMRFSVRSRSHSYSPGIGVLCQLCHKINKNDRPSKHLTINKCCLNVSPTSKTPGHHWINSEPRHGKSTDRVAPIYKRKFQPHFKGKLLWANVAIKLLTVHLIASTFKIKHLHDNKTSVLLWGWKIYREPVTASLKWKQLLCVGIGWVRWCCIDFLTWHTDARLACKA